MGRAPAGLVPLQVAMPPRLNVLHLVFDPNGFRKIIVNWEAIAKALLNEAYRRLAWARDETLRQLITEILSYPGVPSRWRFSNILAPFAKAHTPVGPGEIGVVFFINTFFIVVVHNSSHTGRQADAPHTRSCRDQRAVCNRPARGPARNANELDAHRYHRLGWGRDRDRDR